MNPPKADFENYDLDLTRTHGVQTQTVRDLIEGNFVGHSKVILAGAIGIKFTGKSIRSNPPEK